MEIIHFTETVADLMSKDVQALQEMDVLQKAMDLIEKHQIHHIPIINDAQKVVGMISTHDIHKILHGMTLFNTARSEVYNQNILQTLLVTDVMTKPVVTIRENEPIQLAASYFKENRFHALAVINADQELVGMLTTYDLLTHAYN